MFLYDFCNNICIVSCSVGLSQVYVYVFLKVVGCLSSPWQWSNLMVLRYVCVYVNICFFCPLIDLVMKKIQLLFNVLGSQFWLLSGSTTVFLLY